KRGELSPVPRGTPIGQGSGPETRTSPRTFQATGEVGHIVLHWHHGTMQDSASAEKAEQLLKKMAPPKPGASPEPRPEDEAPLPRKFGRLTLLKAIAR